MLQKKIIGILGIWLLVSAILLQSAQSNVINLIIVGIVSAIAGLTFTVKKTFEGWIGAVLGLWLIISAFIPSLENVPCRYCNIFATGVVLIIIGFSRAKEKVDSTKFYEDNSQFHQ